MNPVDLGYAAGWRVVRALPAPAARALFRAAADYAFRKNGKGTQRLRVNLRRVIGPDAPDAELEALVKAGLRSYARYWMEAFRLPSRTHEQHLDDFRIDNEELLADLVKAGNGVIMALPHSGNWDVAGAWVAAKGWPITTVAERLKPESVYERFLAFRRSLGMEIIPLTGGDQPVFDVLVDRLEAGGTVPLLSDRDLSSRGVEVTFFGGRTRIAPGPALLAIRTGSPLLAVEVWYDDDCTRAHLTQIEIPSPDAGTLSERVKMVAQRIADLFQESIARHPQDWHMLQRMWLDSAPQVAPPAPVGQSPTSEV